MSIKRLMFLVSIVCIILLVSGCCGAMNVQNKNTAITSWNDWADKQHSFDGKATTTLTVFGDHKTIYKNEITTSSPNYDMLKSNLETDKANFESWDSYLSDIDSATLDFSSKSASFSGDSKKYADDMLTNMRTYHTEMQRAQTAYEVSCSDLIDYLDSAQKGHPDETLLRAANTKNDDAYTALQNAIAAGDKAMDSVKRLQSS